jgi:hypothetical protein
MSGSIIHRREVPDARAVGNSILSDNVAGEMILYMHAEFGSPRVSVWPLTTKYLSGVRVPGKMAMTFLCNRVTPQMFETKSKYVGCRRPPDAALISWNFL